MGSDSFPPSVWSCGARGGRGCAGPLRAIGLVSTRFQVPGLSAFYLLLVLWLGATWGKLATAALRSPEVTAPLSLLSERATRLNGVSRFALVAMDFGSAVPLAGGRGERRSATIRPILGTLSTSRGLGTGLTLLMAPVE